MVPDLRQYEKGATTSKTTFEDGHSRAYIDRPDPTNMDRLGILWTRVGRKGKRERPEWAFENVQEQSDHMDILEQTDQGGHSITDQGRASRRGEIYKKPTRVDILEQTDQGRRVGIRADDKRVNRPGWGIIRQTRMGHYRADRPD